MEIFMINEIILETVDNSNLKKVTEVIKQNPIGVGSLLAALYILYSKSKDKENKIEAALNAFPEAAKKALIFLISAHGMKNILFGNVDMKNAGKILNNTNTPTLHSNNTTNADDGQTNNNQSVSSQKLRQQHHTPKYKFINGKLIQQNK